MSAFSGGQAGAKGADQQRGGANARVGRVCSASRRERYDCHRRTKSVSKFYKFMSLWVTKHLYVLDAPRFNEIGAIFAQHSLDTA
jgi:hypothetical protein